MRSLERLARAISFVGQIGFSLVTPPLVLIWLARLAQTKLGWGAWVMIAAIVVGLITGLTSAWRLARGFSESEKSKKPEGRNFNDHI